MAGSETPPSLLDHGGEPPAPPSAPANTGRTFAAPRSQLRLQNSRNSAIRRWLVDAAAGGEVYCERDDSSTPRAGIEGEEVKFNEATTMRVVLKDDSWEDFCTNAVAALKNPQAWIYVDTSFLMWMTKIGLPSLEQLVAWLKKNCGDRIHVPLWAAHEYVNHHVNGTLIDELDSKLGEMSAIASSAYEYLRPFFDAPFDAFKTAEAQQGELRATLNSLQAAADQGKKWKKTYKDHAAEVVKFIAEHSSGGTSVFQLISEFPELGVARFDGRLPPGFKDRLKSVKTDKSDKTGKGAEEVVGSNKYGDLIFWREILDHAAKKQAKTIVILSKDCKNDWHMGGRSQPEDQALKALRKVWKPIPRPHPTLVVEAQTLARADDLLLIDSVYMGMLLRQVAPDETKLFADVAIVPDPATPKEERKAAAAHAMNLRESQEAAHAVATGHLFSDPSNVSAKGNSLDIAFVRCWSGPQAEMPSRAVIDKFSVDIAEASNVPQLVTEKTLQNFATVDFVLFGKGLHDQVLQQTAGALEAATDVVSQLTHFPPGAGSAVYLGFLTSMYFMAKKQARIPPTSPLMDQLMSLDNQEFSVAALGVIGKRLADLEQQPLYCISDKHELFKIELKFEADDPDNVMLKSALVSDIYALVSGIDLLTELQLDPSLNLKKLCGGQDTVKGEIIAGLLCSIFGIPSKYMKYSSELESEFKLPETLGFRDPTTMFNQKGGQND